MEETTCRIGGGCVETLSPRDGPITAESLRLALAERGSRSGAPPLRSLTLAGLDAACATVGSLGALPASVTSLSFEFFSPGPETLRHCFALGSLEEVSYHVMHGSDADTDAIASGVAARAAGLRRCEVLTYGGVSREASARLASAVLGHPCRVPRKVSLWGFDFSDGDPPGDEDRGAPVVAFGDGDGGTCPLEMLALRGCKARGGTRFTALVLGAVRALRPVSVDVASVSDLRETGRVPEIASALRDACAQRAGPVRAFLGLSYLDLDEDTLCRTVEGLCAGNDNQNADTTFDLDVVGTLLTPRAARVIAARIADGTVTSLEARDCMLREEGIGPISAALADPRCATTFLGLRNNELERAGCALLGSGIARNASLITIVATDNFAGTDGAVALARGVNASATVRDCTFRDVYEEGPAIDFDRVAQELRDAVTVAVPFSREQATAFLHAAGSAFPLTSLPVAILPCVVDVARNHVPRVIDPSEKCITTANMVGRREVQACKGLGLS